MNNIITDLFLGNSHCLSSGISYSDADVRSDESRPRPMPSILTCGSRGAKDPWKFESFDPTPPEESGYRTLLRITTTRLRSGLTREKLEVLRKKQKSVTRMEAKINTQTTVTAAPTTAVEQVDATLRSPEQQ